MSVHDEKQSVVRHLTWAGEFLRDLSLVVEVRDEGYPVVGRCHGCGEGLRSQSAEVRQWARRHAPECRALPKAVA